MISKKTKKELINENPCKICITRCKCLLLYKHDIRVAIGSYIFLRDLKHKCDLFRKYLTILDTIFNFNSLLIIQTIFPELNIELETDEKVKKDQENWLLCKF